MNIESVKGGMEPKKEPGPINPDKLVALLNKAYDSYNGKEYKQKTTFSPSRIGYGFGQCPRFWYIAFDGAEWEEDNAPLSWANMKSGTDAHERLGDLIERSGLDVKGLEVELLHDDPPIRGFIDLIVDRAGDEVIGEIKTTRMESFRAKQNSMTPPGYHKAQILIYMYLREADLGFFLYENKNDHQFLVIPIYMDEENKKYIEDLFQWMRDVRKNWEDRVLPQIPYRKNSRVCKDCPVRDTCFNQYEEGEIKFDTAPIG